MESSEALIKAALHLHNMYFNGQVPFIWAGAQVHVNKVQIHFILFYLPPLPTHVFTMTVFRH